MFVVTNREITKRRGLGQFGRRPNREGPNEIRLFDVRQDGSAWRVRPLNDRLSSAQLRALIQTHQLPIDPDGGRIWYASLKVACEVAQRAREEKKDVLVYVHGFNNDMRDVLSAAASIAATHNVIVLPFTWPANGGGPISGTLSYREDKRDARASAGGA